MLAGPRADTAASNTIMGLDKDEILGKTVLRALKALA
jgi:hypothetical protein